MEPSGKAIYSCPSHYTNPTYLDVYPIYTYNPIVSDVQHYDKLSLVDYFSIMHTQHDLIS